MNKIKTAIIGAAILAGVAIPVTIQRQAQARIRERDSLVQQQSDQLAALIDENTRLSNLVVRASQTSTDPTAELLRLRGEVGLLKQQLAGRAAQPSKTTLQPTASTPSDPQEEQMSVARMNFAKQSMLALMSYAAENQGRFTTNLADAEPGLVQEAQHHNLAMDQFEVLYQGSLNDLTNPANTIIMREKEPRQAAQGTWKRVYGFADGHSETHETPDGNFKPWEQQHILLSPSGGQ